MKKFKLKKFGLKLFKRTGTPKAISDILQKATRGLSTRVLEAIFRGNLYGRFNNLNREALGRFLKNDCKSLLNNETYFQDQFHDIPSSINLKKKKPISPDMLCNSLYSGNVFLTKNKSLIFITVISKDMRKNLRLRANSYIYIVGVNFKKDIAIINKYWEELGSKNNTRVSISSLSGRPKFVLVKPKESIFSDQLDDVYKNIDQILYKFKISKQFMISAVSGIVLYGNPGTGKSMISKAICKYITDKNIYDDVNIVSITKSDLRKKDNIQLIAGELTNDIDDLNVIILDDCDMVMEPRKDEEDKKINLTADIMSILDNGFPGVEGPLLVIMTTNFKDKIDPAILRPGRTDYIQEITNISVETARRMCSKYKQDLNVLYKDNPDLIDHSNQVNPAYLQKIIINSLSEKNQRKEGN